MDTIDLRGRLEQIAQAEEQRTKRYIRLIALFQAEPKGKEESTTFEKLRDKLVEAGIPAEQIAIRTADVNELKHVELMSPDCPIRYIITVNALKEGWDCPFAYILASLANKTSQVDVEQVLGRVLRLPHTKENRQPSLNMSYVLTSSNDFKQTVQSIIRGLNNAGFTDKDYRLPEPSIPKTQEQPSAQMELSSISEEPANEPEDAFPDVDSSAIAEELERRQVEPAPRAEDMLAMAEQAGNAYTQAMEQNAADSYGSSLSWEVQDKMNTFSVKSEFAGDIEHLTIPQFFRKIPESPFTEGMMELLDCEQLAEGFTLKGKAYDIDFATADDRIRKVDVKENEGGVPKAFKMGETDQRAFKEYFNSLPPEAKVRQCKAQIKGILNKIDTVDAGELSAYVDLIVDAMDKE